MKWAARVTAYDLWVRGSWRLGAGGLGKTDFLLLSLCTSCISILETIPNIQRNLWDRRIVALMKKPFFFFLAAPLDR